MDDRESMGMPAKPVAANPVVSAGATDSIPSFNDELLSGTGSIPLVSSTGSMSRSAITEAAQAAAERGGDSFSTASAPAAPRYVRRRTPHRSQGSLDDLVDDSESSATYTHDSNISVGGATPLSGMSYRMARSNMSRVKNNSRYGQYLEIPKGRRTIFASRERARRRRSVLALLIVVALLVLAAMFLWNMMQDVLG